MGRNAADRSGTLAPAASFSRLLFLKGDTRFTTTALVFQVPAQRAAAPARLGVELLGWVRARSPS